MLKFVTEPGYYKFPTHFSVLINLQLLTKNFFLAMLTTLVSLVSISQFILTDIFTSIDHAASNRKMATKLIQITSSICYCNLPKFIFQPQTGTRDLRNMCSVVIFSPFRNIFCSPFLVTSVRCSVRICRVLHCKRQYWTYLGTVIVK